jgi:hypothetical protein
MATQAIITDVTEAELAALVIAATLEEGCQYRDTTNDKLYFATGNNTYIQFSTPMTQISGLVLTQANWYENGTFWKYDLANANIKANDFVEVIPSNDDFVIVQTAEILAETTVTAGQVTIYANFEPTGDVNVTINITQRD